MGVLVERSHRREAMKMNRSGRSKFWESVGAVLFLLFIGLCVLSYVSLSIDGGICDTPFGANDLRCVGHFR